MITKDDDKGDDKKLKDQSKNNPSNQVRIKNNSRVQDRIKRRIQDSRGKLRVKNQDSRFKISRIKIKIQDSREGLIKISMKSFSQKLSST